MGGQHCPAAFFRLGSRLVCYVLPALLYEVLCAWDCCCCCSDSRREYVMVPYMDMINHQSGVKNNYYYSHGPFNVMNRKLPLLSSLHSCFFWLRAEQ